MGPEPGADPAAGSGSVPVPHPPSPWGDENAPSVIPFAEIVDWSPIAIMAVEPIGVTARPIHRILFAVMAAAPAASLDPVQTTPALPPPRLLG